MLLFTPSLVTLLGNCVSPALDPGDLEDQDHGLEHGVYTVNTKRLMFNEPPAEGKTGSHL